MSGEPSSSNIHRTRIAVLISGSGSNLQALIDTCYEAGTYGDINYTAEPEPPFQGDDARWTDAWLKQAGRR